MSGQDDQRREPRTRIVAAAADLLQEHGSIGVTTRGVAERAGVQAPTIYRLFGDKDGLLDAVAEHVMETFTSAKAAAVTDAVQQDTSPLDDLRVGWDMTIDFGLTHPALFTLISDPERGSRSPAAQSGIQLLASRVHRVALTGRLGVSEQRAVDLIHAAGVGAILAILAMPSDRRETDLADQMYDAVLREILTDAPVRTPDEPRSTAIALRAAAAELTALSEAERGLLTEWLDRVIDPD